MQPFGWATGILIHRKSVAACKLVHVCSEVRCRCVAIYRTYISETVLPLGIALERYTRGMLAKCHHGLQECTKSIMVSEIERGKQICLESRATMGQTLDFARLTEPLDFFGPSGCANYLQVMVAASSVEDFIKWSGYMNSRVKHLNSRLHNLQGQLIARPWPKEIKVPMCVSLHPRIVSAFALHACLCFPARWSGLGELLTVISLVVPLWVAQLGVAGRHSRISMSMCDVAFIPICVPCLLYILYFWAAASENM
jgi:hypothetical protein